MQIFVKRLFPFSPERGSQPGRFRQKERTGPQWTKTGLDFPFKTNYAKGGNIFIKLFLKFFTIMKKNLYIFRHGQTDFNLHNIWQGCQCNPDLNETGRRQAYELGQKLLPLNLEVIYASPLKRALQTAEIAAGQMKPTPKIEIIPNLREGNFGLAEGSRIGKLMRDCPELTEQIVNPTKETWDKAFPGRDSESKHEIFDRVIGALGEIVLYPGDNIGISAHGGVLSALACGLELSDVDCENCAVLHLTYDKATRTFARAE